MLVNVPLFYYRLSPTVLTVNDRRFKEVYLKEAAAVSREIGWQAKGWLHKPATIIRPGFGPGSENKVFSDNL